MVGRDFGNGAFLGTSTSRYMIEIEPVANTAMLTSAQGVRLRIDEEAEPLPNVRFPSRELTQSQRPYAQVCRWTPLLRIDGTAYRSCD